MNQKAPEAVGEGITAGDINFAASGAILFMGKKLEPFSLMRQSACQAAGAKMIGAPSKIALQQAREGSSYDGYTLDLILLLYTCSIADELVDLAFINPKEYRKRAHAWAADKGLSYPNQAYIEAIGVFNQVTEQLNDSQFQVVEETKKNEPEAPQLKAAT